MKKLASLLGLIGLMTATHAQTTILDTFNEADQGNLFDCCNVLPINGRHSGAGARSSVAIPFTPAATGKLNEIDVALSDFTDGQSRLKVEVDGSSMGLPGRVKFRFANVTAPEGGQCCTFVALKKLGITQVHAGDVYWIVIGGMQQTPAEAGWNLNSLGQTGAYAVKGNGAWSMTEGTLPAVRVLAR